MISNTPPAVGTPFEKAGFWRRLLRRHTALVGLTLLLTLCSLATVSPWAASFESLPGENHALQPIGASTHWLGTEYHDRDFWAPVVYSTVISLTIGVASAFVAIEVHRLTNWMQRTLWERSP